MNLNSATLKNFAVTALALTLSACLVVVTCAVVPAVKEGREAIGEARRASTRIADVAEVYAAQLSDPRAQKALQAGWEGPAVLNGTLRLVNRQAIPRLLKGLDSLDYLLGRLAKNADSLDALIQHTDKSINTDLLPAIASLARRFDIETGDLSDELQKMIQGGELSLVQLHALLADPNLTAALQNLAGTTGKLNESATHLEGAMRRMPGIAENVEKLSKTTSKLAKASILASIIGTLARAFLPF